MIEEAREDKTPSILEQMKALDVARAKRISDLLKQRDDSTVAHVKHMDNIATELQALGWKRPRAKAVRKATGATAK